MNISISSLEKKHFPVMLDEVIKICDPVKNHKTFLDCTFGGGGYSKALLKFPKSRVIALDRDVSAKDRAKELERNNPNRFKFYNEKFSNPDIAAQLGLIDNIIKPSETRKVIVDSFKDLVNKGELGDKHGNIPL